MQACEHSLFVVIIVWVESIEIAILRLKIAGFIEVLRFYDLASVTRNGVREVKHILSRPSSWPIVIFSPSGSTK